MTYDLAFRLLDQNTDTSSVGPYSSMRKKALELGCMVIPDAHLGYMDPQDELRYRTLFGFGPTSDNVSQILTS